MHSPFFALLSISSLSVNIVSFKHPHTLMVQGTTSDAGKSVMVTAFCRMLARQQISVAPFKPQNMALNSAVTSDGGEIGRAQAVQAEACYLNPTTDMNPVLIKPNSDVGAQLIVNGHAIGNKDAGIYQDYKARLLPQVMAAHHRLSHQYKNVIVEGAGSPAEINLRANDIANMGFAEEADCPVVIVADIDRGGVFAHLYGTYELLSDSERQRIKGFIINRFRGDIALLEPGLRWMEDRCGVPILGVIPYIHDLHVEAEDAINQHQRVSTEQQLNVVVPVYPRASNHTDFDVLRLHPQVNCEFARDASYAERADLIILPGSKNVQADLNWLRSSGWSRAIEKHLRYGGKLIGICGGFQMLGLKIHDPNGIESDTLSSDGLGLLNMETCLQPSKLLTKVQGFALASNCKVKGYEIHAGVSEGRDLELRPYFSIQGMKDGKSTQFKYDGATNEDNNVMGTYIHGVFDQPELLIELLRWSGLNVDKPFDYDAYRDQELNRLADAVEGAISLAKLKQLIEIS